MRDWQRSRALHTLASGGVLACPTEAVWGLSCDPDNPSAVARLLAIKRRPVEAGLILVASAFWQLQPYLEPIDASRQREVERSWPGPVTWLFPVSRLCPPWICGEHQTVAVRVTGHPQLAALCDCWGGPLVSTSANRRGRAPARTSWQLRRALGEDVDWVVGGATGGRRQPSAIRDARSGELLRAG